MIDSIVFVIYDISFTEFRKISSKFKIFGNAKYYFEYNNIIFRYYAQSGTIVITTNAHKVLNKTIVLENDLQKYKEIINKAIIDVLGNCNYKLELSRIDYCVDFKINKQEIVDILELLYKHISSYRHMKIGQVYDTSLYMKTHRGQYTLNIYDKYEQCKLEEYKDIFRIELQIKKNKFKNRAKVYGITREIDNYWSRDSMEELYFEFLKGFFYTADYFRLDIAKQKINKSDYMDSMKVKLNIFIKNINKYGMSAVKKNYANATFIEYINKLEEIGINPITINLNKEYKSMKNLLKRTKEICEEQYFNN